MLSIHDLQNSKQAIIEEEEFLRESLRDVKMLKAQLNGLEQTTGLFTKLFGWNSGRSKRKAQLTRLRKDRRESKKQLEQKGKELRKAIRRHLTNTNTTYQTLLIEARKVLSGNIEFTVYEKVTNHHDMPVMATAFSGQLFDKKALLVQTTKTAFSHAYPKVLRGRIDPYGRIKIRSQQSGGATSMFSTGQGKTPKRYTGHVKENGEVYLKASELSSDFLSDQNIKKMICNPFENIKEKNKYINTMQSLKSLEAKFLEEL